MSLVAAQAQGSNAISRLYRGETQIDTQSKTIADSIAVDRPRDAKLALCALENSRGLCIELSEAEIIEAVGNLARQFGCFVEPSAAASFAAAIRLSRSGMVSYGDKVVCLLTGTGLKDLRPVSAQLDPSLLPIVSPGDWKAIATHH